jgi:hypothetical protein
MDALSVLLEGLKKEPRVREHFLGLLHVLIGRRINSLDGELVSQGLTWRELAAKLKKLRWEPEVVRQLGLEIRELPPRDRERFWYQAISRAKVDSPEAVASAARLGQVFRDLGYEIAPGKTA